MLIHTVFDLAAWLSAWLMARFVARRGWLDGATRTPMRDPAYFIALGLGALAGAYLFGSANMMFAHMWTLGHSIAGAIAGGIIAVELYKLAAGIRQSTGGQFVAPLAIGIAVGRLGCFFAGLPDYTYGTPTSLPWGVDFGDGIRRHPVQLYESAAMLVFLAVYLRGIARRNPLFVRQGFYLFVGWYALQRFAWEFLKPYPVLLGPLNTFHLVCLAMLGYSLFMMRRNHDLRAAIQGL
jgi:phosphatidylglycerol---prolipoprotein diacylglyceryl transferase